MNGKIVTILLLALMCSAIVGTPILMVHAQTSANPVSILQVTPSSMEGPVGQFVNVQGEVYSTNDTYVLFLGPDIVSKGTATGFYVSANFFVPTLPGGTYNLILEDSITGGNSSSDQFQVTTSYIIAALPAQPQEGNNVVLNATVTGGTPSTVYVANVTVVPPSPLTTQYSTIINLGAGNSNGIASGQITFPSSSFQPSGSITDYAGKYAIAFNQTLDTASFTIGFLDSTTYHRSNTVSINAIDYQANQAATLTVTSSVTGATLVTQSLTASASGIITSTWQVPANAVIGSYNVTITPQGTQKAVLDSEDFSVPGYSVEVNTVNLANEGVDSIGVQALDGLTNLVYNSTSSDGAAPLSLENGPASLTAFWNGVNVGTTNITVNGGGNFTLQCQLTDLKFLVQNENGIPMPFVNLTISYGYRTSNGGSSQTGTATGLTDPSGTYTFDSLLTGIGYSVNASLYNQVFNSGNNTVTNVAAQALSQEVVTCPNEALTITVLGNNRSPIANARVELVESTNGLFYTATTDSQGSVSNQVTFGTYKLQVYADNILINQTTINAFASGQMQLHCTTYGIQVSVSVVDLFGNPISNANVTVNGQGTERLTGLTNGGGTVTFNNIIGGNMQIVAFAPGAPSDYQAVTVTVNQPTSVQVKIERFIALGSFLIQASSFLAIILILVAVIALVVVEMLMRRMKRRKD